MFEWPLSAPSLLIKLYISIAIVLHPTHEGVVWVSRDAFWDTVLSEVFSSIDTPLRRNQVFENLSWHQLHELEYPSRWRQDSQRRKAKRKMCGFFLSASGTQQRSSSEYHGTLWNILLFTTWSPSEGFITSSAEEHNFSLKSALTGVPGVVLIWGNQSFS